MLSATTNSSDISECTNHITGSLYIFLFVSDTLITVKVSWANLKISEENNVSVVSFRFRGNLFLKTSVKGKFVGSATEKLKQFA